MATKTGIVGTGGSVSQVLKDAGYKDYASKSTWDQVAKLNNLDSKYTVRVGQKLILPGSAPTTTSTKTALTSKTPSPAPTTSAPRTTGDNINTDLTNFQTDWQTALDSANSPMKTEAEIRAGIMEEFEGLNVPSAPSLKDTYNQLREETGVGKLEDVLTNLKGERLNQEAILRARRATAMGGRVSMDVIGGRVSEIERQERENLEFVDRQISVVSDQLENQNKYIDLMINLTNMDYDNALKSYNAEFNQRMQIMEAIQKEEAQQWDRNFELTKWRQNVASTQIQMYIDLAGKGQLDWKKLDSDTKLAINKLEIMSGLGLGFVSKVKMPPGANIKSITQREGTDGYMYADALIVQADGSLKVQTTKLGRYRMPSSGGGGSSPSAAQVKASEVSAMRNSIEDGILNGKKVSSNYFVGKDGKLSPSGFKFYLNAWNGDKVDFIKAFGSYVNTSHYKDYVDQATFEKYRAYFN